MGFAVSQLLVTQLIGPRKRTATKLMPYECGKDPIGGARDRFSIKFYTVASYSSYSILKSCHGAVRRRVQELLVEQSNSGILYGRSRSLKY
jgi:hypothetical protein